MAAQIAMTDIDGFQKQATDLLTRVSVAPVAAFVLTKSPEGKIANVTWAQSGQAALELAAQLEFHAREIRAAATGLGDAAKPGRSN